MKKQSRFQLFIALLAMTLLFGCSRDPIADGEFGIFSVRNDNTTIVMNGVVESNSFADFQALVQEFPAVDSMVILNCDGSEDDEINLQLSEYIHNLEIPIHLNSNGIIASGGTDLFLAGLRRTRGSSTQIGVHAWSYGANEATDFPVGDPAHQPYIDYYQAIGFSQQWSEDFYYFTINAAPASDIHWMTENEIAQYQMITN